MAKPSKWFLMLHRQHCCFSQHGTVRIPLPCLPCNVCTTSSVCVVVRHGQQCDRLGMPGDPIPTLFEFALSQLPWASTQEEKLRAKQAKLAAQAPGGGGSSAAPSDASSARVCAPWLVNA